MGKRLEHLGRIVNLDMFFYSRKSDEMLKAAGQSHVHKQSIFPVSHYNFAPMKNIACKCKWASFWTSITEVFCVWVLLKWQFVEWIYSLKHDRKQWITKEQKTKFTNRSCMTKLKWMKHHSALSDENWQFSIRMGMIIKFYAIVMIKKEENKQSQFPVSRA